MVNKRQGPAGRAWRLGKLGAGVASSYLGYQLQNIFLRSEDRPERLRKVHRRAFGRVRAEFQDLRGPMMKLGQVLSMQGQALPEEVIDELSALQMKAPAMHPTLMRLQFQNALGKEPDEVFKTFEPEAFAAASLGQVHRAVTRDGEAVAVKIQYPAIREVIANDFRILKTVSFPAKLTGYFSQATLAEMERGILEETDYLREAANAELFRSATRPLGFVRVPRVYRALTTDRVLTMSFLEGLHLESFLARKPSQSLRDLVGTRLIEFFCFQLHHIHVLHVDPHPGNYLFGEDATIGLIDFGCVKRFPPDSVRLCRIMAKREYRQGRAGVEELIRILWGGCRGVSARATREAIGDAIAFFELVYPPDHTDRPVDFGDPKVLKSLTDLWKRVFTRRLISPEFCFSSRAELGLYNLLHRLRARVRTTATLQRVLAMQPLGWTGGGKVMASCCRFA